LINFPSLNHLRGHKRNLGGTASECYGPGRPEQTTVLNATTEQFKIAKISGNALKQGSITHSVLRQRSSQP